MFNVHFTSQFKKDFKACQKRGLDMQKIGTVMQMLENGEKLPEIYRDHNLKGDRRGLRDCHIEPDWLLLYQIKDKTLVFDRTGTHSDLFN